MKFRNVFPVYVFLAVLTGILWCSPAFLQADEPVQKRKDHLAWALMLADQVAPDDTSYRNKKTRVTWKADDGSGSFVAHTDCSGFITALLKKSYEVTDEEMTVWFGLPRPKARRYHDVIAEERGFAAVALVQDIQPGDIIAIRYPEGEQFTGHTMLVTGAPRKRTASFPHKTGTIQWSVPVIDVSRSGHGIEDTRRNGDGSFRHGIGQGTFRIYADEKGAVAGYTWSTLPKSTFYDQGARHLVVGRLRLPGQ